MIRLLLLFALLVATMNTGTLADFQPNYYYNQLADGAGYSFSWNVIDSYSGNDFGHREDRSFKSGTDETRGSYHVLLPDGRVQTVTYFVDPYNGYQAKVLYEGEAKYNDVVYTPQASYVPQPIYQPAPPAPVVLTTTQAPKYTSPAAPASLPVYAPVDYAPAPVSYPHNPVYNLVVPEAEHHQIKHLKEPQNVQPLAPPPKKESKIHHHDPYLKTEEELAHKDFSGPFFYASTKKITRKEKKDEHNRLYHYLY